MALTGLHVWCGYAGSPQGLLGKGVWSQTMASAGTTTQAAPSATTPQGPPMFQVRASADAFVAIGAAPNATTGTRVFVPAGERVEFYAEAGDKLDWIPA